MNFLGKIVVIIYYIWIILFIISGIWLIIDIVKILGGMLIDKIRLWKAMKPIREQKREQKKLNKMYKNAWKEAEQNGDVDVVIEL